MEEIVPNLLLLGALAILGQDHGSARVADGLGALAQTPP